MCWSVLTYCMCKIQCDMYNLMRHVVVCINLHHNVVVWMWLCLSCPGMVAPQLNPLIHSEQMHKYCVLQMDKYICNIIHGRKWACNPALSAPSCCCVACCCTREYAWGCSGWSLVYPHSIVANNCGQIPAGWILCTYNCLVWCQCCYQKHQSCTFLSLSLSLSLSGSSFSFRQLLWRQPRRLGVAPSASQSCSIWSQLKTTPLDRVEGSKVKLVAHPLPRETTDQVSNSAIDLWLKTECVFAHHYSSFSSFNHFWFQFCAAKPAINGGSSAGAYHKYVTQSLAYDMTNLTPNDYNPHYQNLLLQCCSSK